MGKKDCRKAIYQEAIYQEAGSKKAGSKEAGASEMALKEKAVQLWTEVMRRQGSADGERECLDQSAPGQLFLIALDGKCAAGKTTFARVFREMHPEEVTVIHMDHFFLRPEQRTPERLEKPGENVDHERFVQEVLIPLRENGSCSYGVYDCHRQEVTEYVTVETDKSKVVLIEGSYSCHPDLWDYCDLHIFLDVEDEEQYRRIQDRNGVCAAVFRDRWIPLETKYFQAFQIKERCEISF